MVKEEDAQKTVKYILKNKLDLSERLIKKLKQNSSIFLNSVPVFVDKRVSEGDLVSAKIEFDEINENIAAEYMPFDILYKDDCIIAVNKPPGVVMHPTFYHQSGTVANGIMRYLLDKGIRTKIRPVSRLDKDTSGVVLFAMNQYVQEALIKQMKNNTMVKQYIGIVHGHMENESGTIAAPIERKPDSIMLRHLSTEGVSAVTHYQVLERLNGADLLKFRLETGKTHQIRVHCQFVGYPLVGDILYPFLDPSLASSPEVIERNSLIGRQALHSQHTAFSHPLNGLPVSIDAPIPEDFLRPLEMHRIKPSHIDFTVFRPRPFLFKVSQPSSQASTCPQPWQ